MASRGADLPHFEAFAIQTSFALERLPEPSAGDVFLDFEGDPFGAPHGLEYLTGVCTRKNAGEIEFNKQWALQDEQEKSIPEAFIDFALARV